MTYPSRSLPHELVYAIWDFSDVESPPGIPAAPQFSSGIRFLPAGGGLGVLNAHISVLKYRQASNVAAEDPGVGQPIPPAGVRLGQSFPNPAFGKTVIPFELQRPARVSIRLFDVAGRQIALLSDRRYGPGRHAIPLETGRVPQGIYFVQLETSGSRQITAVHVINTLVTSR